MEIERKFLVKSIPENLDSYPVRHIEQGYLSNNPVVRVRRDNDSYYLTYKGKGKMVREEYNLPLTPTSYTHLLKKADGNIITKNRYEIPVKNGLTAELDIFEGIFKGTVIVEVEFSSQEEAESYIKEDWFGEEVTYDSFYSNSSMSQRKL